MRDKPLASRYDVAQPTSRDYDHEIIAPDAVKTAIEAANAFEVMGGAHPTLSLTWEQYLEVPEVRGNCGYPPRPVKVGQVWRVKNKGEFAIGHALQVSKDGMIEGLEWFTVEFSDL